VAGGAGSNRNAELILFVQAYHFVHTHQKELKRFIKFAMVGAAGSVTDLTVLNLLVQLAQLTPVVANYFSFTAAVIQNFTLNRFWTFPESRQRQASTQLAQFFLINLIGLGINTLILAVVHHSLDEFWIHATGDPAMGFFLSYNFAKLFAIGVVLFWNFTANRLWTYRGLSAQS
jgi:putative flippase GtrA